MKQVIWKVYYDYEKEERWLNDMSARGLAMVDYSWCRYVFEEAPQGQWIYRIELLEQLANHPESVAYLRFLEESGVEVVATYMRWVYLRKPATEGAFDLYSDLDSKLAHYKRIHLFWMTLFCAEFAIGMSNLTIALSRLLGSQPNPELGVVNLYFAVPLLCLAGLFLYLDIPLMRKMRLLRREKRVRES